MTFFDPCWMSISMEAKQFIARLLTKDPKRRYTAEKAMLDPFFKEEADQEKKRKLMSTLLKFNDDSKVQRLALNYFVSSLKVDEIDQLRAQFNALDLTQSGLLNQQQLTTAFINVGLS